MATHATILTLAVWWQSQQGGESHSVNSYGLVFSSGCDRTRQYRTWRQASSAPLAATFGTGYSPPFFSSLSPWPSLLSGVTGHRSQPSFLEPERYALCADVFLCVCGRVRGKGGGGWWLRALVPVWCQFHCGGNFTLHKWLQLYFPLTVYLLDFIKFLF